MNVAQGRITFIHVAQEQPKADQVLNALEVVVDLPEFLVDRVKTLVAALNFGGEPEGFQQVLQGLRQLLNFAGTLVPLTRHKLFEILVGPGGEQAEGQILQLGLDPENSEPSCQWHKDMEIRPGNIL